MNEILTNISITERTVYLSIILIIMGEGLKNLPFVKNWMVIWMLTVISILINFLFYGISFNTFVGAIVSTSIAVFGYDVYVQTKKGIVERST